MRNVNAERNLCCPTMSYHGVLAAYNVGNEVDYNYNIGNDDDEGSDNDNGNDNDGIDILRSYLTLNGRTGREGY